MRNIIKITSKFILVIAFLSVFAFLVGHAREGGNKLGIFTMPIIEFSEFPALVKEVFRKSFPSIFKSENFDPDFQPSNNLEYDVIATTAHYNKSKWIISLTNLKNDSIIFRWYLKEKEYLKTTDRVLANSGPKGPILLKDKSIIFALTGTFNLFRLDKQSKIIWHNTDHLFHHSINMDKEGNVWACTRKIIEFSKYIDGEYLDDYITKIDVENGNTLYNKSVREILIDNDLAYLVYGIGDEVSLASFKVDPLHLNDIEPVLKDGPYWKAGDLFLSFRHRSTILLYRPSTNLVLRVIAGPFLNQHDIDIQSDSIISIFNNNVSNFPSKIYSNLIAELQPITNPLWNKTSNVLKYNFSDSTFTPIYQGQFIENKIKTQTNGLHHILSNGDMFVESYKDGKVYIFNENEVLLKKYMNEVHWTRIYENINF
jgi:hypothetical protein